MYVCCLMDDSDKSNSNKFPVLQMNIGFGVYTTENLFCFVLGLIRYVDFCWNICCIIFQVLLVFGVFHHKTYPTTVM